MFFNLIITLRKNLIISILARRYRADRQNLMDKVKFKAQDRPIVYNWSKKTEFVSIGIFILIIVNFILFCLLLSSTIVANFIIALRQEIIMDIPEGGIRADCLEIEFKLAPLISNEPQRVKLYNLATLPLKIQLWLIVGFSLSSLITNLTSFSSSFHLLSESNSTL